MYKFVKVRYNIKYLYKFKPPQVENIGNIGNIGNWERDHYEKNYFIYAYGRHAVRNDLRICA